MITPVYQLIPSTIPPLESTHPIPSFPSSQLIARPLSSQLSLWATFPSFGQPTACTLSALNQFKKQKLSIR